MRLGGQRATPTGPSPVRDHRAARPPSPSIATALNSVPRYEEVASIAKQALAERKAIRQVVIERGHVEKGTITLEDLDRLLDEMRMTGSS